MIVAMPLDAGLSQAFVASLQRPHADVHVSWVKMYQEGINPNLYYRWSKDFLEAGKKRLSGDTAREANTDEVTGLKRENSDLKQAVAELYLRNDWLKKSLTGQGVILDED